MSSCPIGTRSSVRLRPCASASESRIAPGTDHSGIIFLTCRSAKSTTMPLNPSISPIDVTTTLLHLRAADHLAERLREVLDDDDRLGARIARAGARARARVYSGLTFTTVQPARRMPNRHDRVLQDVGHHQRDAGALLEALPLQPRAERRRQRVELGEGDALAHARERGARGVRRARLLEDLADRCVLVDVDGRRNAARIARKPDLVHDFLLVATASPRRCPMRGRCPWAPPDRPPAGQGERPLACPRRDAARTRDATPPVRAPDVAWVGTVRRPAA